MANDHCAYCPIPIAKGRGLGTAAIYSITWQGFVELVVKMHKVHKHVVSHQGLWEEYKQNGPLEHIFEESSDITNFRHAEQL